MLGVLLCSPQEGQDGFASNFAFEFRSGTELYTAFFVEPNVDVSHAGPIGDHDALRELCSSYRRNSSVFLFEVRDKTYVLRVCIQIGRAYEPSARCCAY
jgi:hypothetical protein